MSVRELKQVALRSLGVAGQDPTERPFVYVYLLRSRSNPAKTYIGITGDLDKRLEEHNKGKSPHTSRFMPWELVVSVYFADRDKAKTFERYLKHGSGHAFANRHFW